MDTNREQMLHTPRRAGGLSVLLTLAALVCLLLAFAATANAETIASGYCGGEDDGTNLTWTLDSEGTLTISGTGKMKDYDYDNSAPWLADSYRSRLKTLVLRDGITSISFSAFNECDSFTGNLIIPDSVTSIGAYAFYGCSGFTGALILPDTISSIGTGAFANCSGFSGSLNIPSRISCIESSIFRGCSGFNGTLTIPNSVTSIGLCAFSDCKGLIGSLVIPDNVVTIEHSAFKGCSGFTSDLVIPDSVSTIDYSAFAYCSGLNGNLIISKGIDEIKWSTFSGCSGLTGNLNIPEGITSIGMGAFSGCTGFNGRLTIPQSVSNIDYLAFSGCSGFTGRLIFPDSISHIGWAAFSGCSGFTGDLIIPSSISKIEQRTFENCSGFDGTLTISDSVTSIGASAFYNCSGFIGNLSIPGSVASIGKEAFKNCSGFTGNLTIAGSVAAIEYGTFENCSGFTGNLTIANGVTSVGEYAFHNCSGFTGNLTIPDSVTSIGGSAFENCSGFNGNLTISGSISTIEYGTFRNCSGFTGNLVIPSSVTSISSSAFADCSGFNGTLTIPNSVTSIDSSAFIRCSGFTGDLTLPDSLSVISTHAFEGCSGFDGTLTIPDSITCIDPSAFIGCSKLSGKLIIPGSVSTIGNNAFNNCDGFTSITILDGVEESYDFAFSCASVTAIHLPSSMTCINYSFEDCDSLQTVYYDGTRAQLDELYEFPSDVRIICTQDAGENGTILSFSQKEFTVPFGGEVLLTLNITSAAGMAQEQLDSITWISSNPSVFPENTLEPVGTQSSGETWRFRSIVYDREDTTGDIFFTAKPLAPGTASVTLMTEDGAAATCTVTVTCTGNTITMDSSEYKLAAGAEGEVFAEISNGEALGEYSWEWSSSNESVVVLTGEKSEEYICVAGETPDGRHTAHMTFRARNPGTAVLTCTLSSGQSASRTITVLSAEDAKKESTVESNYYDRPKTRDPQQEQNLSVLDKYNAMLRDAFDAYMKALETGVNKLKAEECGGASSIMEQVDALQALDKNRTGKYLTPDISMPETYLDFCYQALCTCLLEGTQNANGLSKLDVSTIYKADSNIVKEIVKRIGGTKKKLTYPNVTIQVNLTSALSASFGKMYVKEDGLFGRSYTVVVCSTLNDVNKLVADYLNELKKLERNAINNIYRAIAKDIFGQSLSSFTEKYLTDKFRPALKDFFKNHGFGTVDKTLGSIYTYYNTLKSLRSTILRPDAFSFVDPTSTLNNYITSSEGISDQLAKQAAKKLVKVQKEIIQAIVDYKNKGEITAPEGPDFWDMLLGIQCPVSVAVYDGSGNQIGYVGDDDLWYNDGLYIETDGEAKLIYLLNKQTISLKITGTDYGAVSCMLEKWADGEPVYRTNYYDIAVENGSEILVDGQAYALSSQSAPFLTAGKQKVYADEQITAAQSACMRVSAAVNSESGGYVTGGGAYVRGDPVLFRAYPSEGYDFIGWYDEDSQLVSVESCYEFTAREPVSLTAFFAVHEPSLENYLVELSDAYEGRCSITVEQTGTDYTLTISCLNETLDLSSFSVCAAQYDQTGRMLGVCFLPRQITEQGAVFTGSLTQTGATLFILDAAGRPAAQALISE